MDEMKHFQSDEPGAVKKSPLGDNRDEFVSVFECKKIAGKMRKERRADKRMDTSKDGHEEGYF